MNKSNLITACLLAVCFFSCSRKTIPVKEPEKPAEVVSVAKPAPVKIIKTPVPKFIVVNDAVAKKTFDGRLYYDLEGHRYWRSNKDGKYYKYYKGMQDNPAFKAP